MSGYEKPTAEHFPRNESQGSAGDVHVGDEAPHHGMSVGEYIRTRFTSLKPPMAKTPNPFKLLRMLTAHHWAFFGVAFFAWVRCAACLICIDRAELSVARQKVNC